MNLSRSRRRRKQRDGDLSESASLSPTNSVGMDQLETVDYTVHTNDLFLSDINPTNIYLDQNIQEWLTTLLQSTPKANAAILKVMRKDDIQTVRDLGRYSDTWLLDNANQEIIQPIYRIKFNAIVKHIHLLLEEEVPQAHVEESQGSDYDPNGGEISLAKSFGKSSSDSDETESEEDADQADENEGEGDNEEDDTRNSNGRKTSMTSSQSVMVHFARHAGSHSPIPQLLNVPEDDDDDDAEQQHHEPEDNDEEEEEKEEEEEEEEDQLEAFPPSPIPSPTSKESVPAPKSPPWTAPPPPLPVPPTFDLNSSTKKSKKRARKDETVHQQFQRTTSEAAANSKNQKFKRTASEAAKLRRSQANNKSSSSSSSSTTTPLKKKQKIEFDLQVGDFCDYYIRGYGWYTAKINRMISSDQVELINFDSHPDDRSTYKIKLNKLTKSGRKLWAPFGEETCETPYVHDTDLSLQKQLQSLIRTMKVRGKMIYFSSFEKSIFIVCVTVLDCNYRKKSFLSVHSCFNVFSSITPFQQIQTVLLTFLNFSTTLAPVIRTSSFLKRRHSGFIEIQTTVIIYGICILDDRSHTFGLVIRRITMLSYLNQWIFINWRIT